MKKSLTTYRTALAIGMLMTLVLSCGCSLRRTANVNNKQTAQIASDERISQYITSSKIDIEISVAGDDPFFTNDDISSIDVMKSIEDKGIYLMFNLSEIGLARANSKNINIEDKSLSVTANGAQALTPPVFGKIRDNCLVIYGVGGLEEAQDAAMIMTSYDYNLAIKNGYTTQEEYEKSLVVEEPEYEDKEENVYIHEPEIDEHNPEPEPAPPASGATIIYRVRKSANDAQSQIGAFNYIDNAIRLAEQRSSEGYKVYDQYGNLIYAP